MKTQIDHTLKNGRIYEVSNSDKLQVMHGIWTGGKTYWKKPTEDSALYEDGISFRVRKENVHPQISFFHYSLCNHGSCEKPVKLLTRHFLAESSPDHLTFISPAENVVFHMCGEMVLMANSLSTPGQINKSTIQPLWNLSSDSIWSCREKGILQYMPMAKGAAASILSIDMILEPGETKRSASWVIEGTTKNELLALNYSLLKNRLAFPNKR